MVFSRRQQRLAEKGSHCGLLPLGEASAKGFPQMEQVAWDAKGEGEPLRLIARLVSLRGNKLRAAYPQSLQVG